MADPYTSVTISNYNANPPPDDGTQVAANEIKHSVAVTKIGDPLKTAIESVDSNITTAFGKIVGGAGVTTYATNSTVQTSDQGKLVRASAEITLTTPDAASVESPFVFGVVNDSGGVVTLDGNGAQTVNGETTVTLKDQEGGFCFTDGSNWFLIGNTVGPVLTAEAATTSGTTSDITGIPSWATIIIGHIAGVSTNGTNALAIQLGDSGGIEATGYLGSVHNIGGAAALPTTQMSLDSGRAATSVSHGNFILALEDAANNVWSMHGNIGRSDTALVSAFAYTKALSDTLTQARLLDGGDTFDAGAWSLTYL